MWELSNLHLMTSSLCVTQVHYLGQRLITHLCFILVVRKLLICILSIMRALNFLMLSLSSFVFLMQLTEEDTVLTFTICYAQFFPPTDLQKSLSYVFLHSLSPCCSLWAGVFICWLHRHKCKTVLSVPMLWPEICQFNINMYYVPHEGIFTYV